MHQVTKRGLWLLTPVLVFVLHASPTWASGDFYVNANSANKNDGNSCRTKAAPCATLGGVLDKVLATSSPENSTVHAKGTFIESISITNSELEGLTLTWYGQGSDRPVVDAAGAENAITVANVNSVTFNHLDITNANSYGVYAYGNSNSHATGLRIKHSRIHDFTIGGTTHTAIYVLYMDDAVISHNKIYSIGSENNNLDSSPQTNGIYVVVSSHPKILNNSIHDIGVTATFGEASSSVYVNLIGIYVSQGEGALVRNNVLKDLTTTANDDYTSGYAYAVTYPIYVYNSNDSDLSHNTILRNSARGVSTQDGVAAYTYVYSLYASGSDNLTVHGNHLQTISSTTTVLDDETNLPALYGIYLVSSEHASVVHNSLRSLTSTSTNGAGTAVSYGMIYSATPDLQMTHNTLRSIQANSQGSGGATVYAIHLTDAARANIVRNKVYNFEATGDEPNYNASMYGVYIGYNSNTDLVNNLFYFTTPVVHAVIDGVAVVSTQADPVRALNNTFLNMRSCLDISNGAEVDFQNNICLLKTSGAFGIQVDTEVYDISQLNSNHNIFFNTIENVQMNDAATGVLSFGDWKSGEYDQDKNSLKKNPDLKLSPTTAPRYLHLKASSPAIDAGNNQIDFGHDEVMNAWLMKDYDLDARPQGTKVDIGADEFTL